MNKTALRRVPGLLVLGLGIVIVLIAAVQVFPLMFGPTHEFVVEDAPDIEQRAYHFETLSPQAQAITAQTVASGHLVTTRKPSAYAADGTYYIRINGGYRGIRSVQSGTRAVPNETRRQPVYTYRLVAGNQTEISGFSDQPTTATLQADTRDTVSSTDSVEQPTPTPVFSTRDSAGVYDFSDLTGREQRILQRASDTESGIATAHTSGEHFRVEGGHSPYYIHVEDTYYAVRVRQTTNTGFGAGLAMYLWLVVIGIGGAVVLSALISLHQTPPSVAGPSALLSGSAIVAATVLTTPSDEKITGDVVPWSIAVIILVYGGFFLYHRWHDKDTQGA